jgi:hypothetical protein
VAVVFADIHPAGKIPNGGVGSDHEVHFALARKAERKRDAANGGEKKGVTQERIHHGRPAWQLPAIGNFGLFK